MGNLKLEYMNSMLKEKEIAERNERALEYIESVKARRKQSLTLKAELYAVGVLGSMLLLLMI